MMKAWISVTRTGYVRVYHLNKWCARRTNTPKEVPIKVARKITMRGCKTCVGTIIMLFATVGVNANASTSKPYWRDTWVSTYTWNNNSPPGCGIEYPIIHKCAGGIGTYTNPITFASQLNEWRPGTRIYIPYFHDYFIKEDYCSTCYSLPYAYQVDLWAGKASDDSAIANFWRKLRIEINPPRGLPVNTTPLKYRG